MHLRSDNLSGPTGPPPRLASPASTSPSIGYGSGSTSLRVDRRSDPITVMWDNGVSRSAGTRSDSACRRIRTPSGEVADLPPDMWAWFPALCNSPPESDNAVSGTVEDVKRIYRHLACGEGEAGSFDRSLLRDLGLPSPHDAAIGSEFRPEGEPGISLTTAGVRGEGEGPGVIGERGRSGTPLVLPSRESSFSLHGNGGGHGHNETTPKVPAAGGTTAGGYGPRLVAHRGCWPNDPNARAQVRPSVVHSGCEGAGTSPNRSPGVIAPARGFPFAAFSSDEHLDDVIVHKGGTPMSSVHRGDVPSTASQARSGGRPIGTGRMSSSSSSPSSPPSSSSSSSSSSPRPPSPPPHTSIFTTTVLPSMGRHPRTLVFDVDVHSAAAAIAASGAGAISAPSEGLRVILTSLVLKAVIPEAPEGYAWMSDTSHRVVKVASLQVGSVSKEGDLWYDFVEEMPGWANRCVAHARGMWPSMTNADALGPSASARLITIPLAFADILPCGHSGFTSRDKECSGLGAAAVLKAGDGDGGGRGGRGGGGGGGGGGRIRGGVPPSLLRVQVDAERTAGLLVLDSRRLDSGGTASPSDTETVGRSGGMNAMWATSEGAPEDVGEVKSLDIHTQGGCYLGKLRWALDVGAIVGYKPPTGEATDPGDKDGDGEPTLPGGASLSREGSKGVSAPKGGPSPAAEHPSGRNDQEHPREESMRDELERMRARKERTHPGSPICASRGDGQSAPRRSASIPIPCRAVATAQAMATRTTSTAGPGDVALSLKMRTPDRPVFVRGFLLVVDFAPSHGRDVPSLGPCCHPLGRATVSMDGDEVCAFDWPDLVEWNWLKCGLRCPNDGGGFDTGARATAGISGGNGPREGRRGGLDDGEACLARLQAESGCSASLLMPLCVGDPFAAPQADEMCGVFASAGCAVRIEMRGSALGGCVRNYSVKAAMFACDAYQ